MPDMPPRARADQKGPTVTRSASGIPLTNGQPMSTGVLVGCGAHSGHFVGKEVVGWALTLGWADTMAAGAHETYDDWYWREDWAHFDHWHDTVHAAEVWLNDNTVGGHYSWFDGDFRLDATEECPHCGGERFTDPDHEDFDCAEHLPSA